MPVSSVSARHRAASRPVTALSDFLSTATGTLTIVGRRSVVVAASSGLAMSVLAVPASAAVPARPATIHPAVDISALTSAARTALETAPAVTVPADTAWTLDIPAITVVVDPPPPPPPPRPVVRAASRSQARAAVTPAEDPAPVIGASAPASANGDAIVEIASRYVGVPYLWGGTTPDGFDCSGYTSYVFAQLGISLPRTSSAQRNIGTVVSRADAQPGDLIWSPGHIAIYAGGDQQVDAPRPGKTIQIRTIWQSSPTFIRVS